MQSHDSKISLMVELFVYIIKHEEVDDDELLTWKKNNHLSVSIPLLDILWTYI